MTGFDIDGFRSRITVAACKAVERFKSEMPEAEICGFALYSDSDATSVASSFNTVTHLAAMQAEYPEDPFCFKWNPSEWSHEGFGEEFFEDLSSDMLKLSQSFSSFTEFEAYRSDVFNVCVDVLKELRKVELKEVIFVFSITDSILPEMQIKWIGSINTPLETAEFERWIVQQ